LHLCDIDHYSRTDSIVLKGWM